MTLDIHPNRNANPIIVSKNGKKGNYENNLS
jgi:hypothetical protein